MKLQLVGMIKGEKCIFHRLRANRRSNRARRRGLPIIDCLDQKIERRVPEIQWVCWFDICVEIGGIMSFSWLERGATATVLWSCARVVLERCHLNLLAFLDSNPAFIPATTIMATRNITR